MEKNKFFIILCNERKLWIIWTSSKCKLEDIFTVKVGILHEESSFYILRETHILLFVKEWTKSDMVW